jgi:DNA repair protein RadA/Sms
MARLRSMHRCTECGAVAPRWAGRCSACGTWNSLLEEVERPPAFDDVAARTTCGPVAFTDIDAVGGVPLPTGVSEFDRVLGGGLVPGSVTVLGGEPGIGKSTLVLQLLSGLARQGGRGLLVSAEESPAQVRQRVERLDALAPGLWLVGETSMPGIRAAIQEISPDLVVIDSIQTVFDPELESPPGSVVQVRGCAQQLAALAKAGGPITVLVGHVTKEGTLAGPRLLEHLVDTVLSFDGDRHHALRLLRSAKHRFGPAGELGLFEMTSAGLEGVADAGKLFLADRRSGTAGSVVFPSMEGGRPVLVEIQALVVSSQLPTPRRSATGFDAGRLALLVAVLDRRAGLALGKHDLYVSVVGGVRVADPGADLAVCLALASAFTGEAVGDDVVVLGEVGLGGEVRQVAHTPRRLVEAARLGFSRALVPDRGPEEAPLALRRVPTLVGALEGCASASAPAARPLRVVGEQRRMRHSPGGSPGAFL